MKCEGPVIIVGAGHAGFQLAASLRQSGFDDRVVLINNEPHLPYQRPPLSKAFLEGTAAPESIAFRPLKFFEDNHIELVADQALEIVRAARKLTLQSSQPLSYGHLVLATGARARMLQVPNADHPDVLYLRSLSDSETIRRRLSDIERVVVIGGGFIGLEFAATAAAKGIQVDIIELAPRIMARVVSRDVSDYFEKQHEKAGCRIHRTRSLSAIAVSHGSLDSVELDNGHRIPADLIVVGIGVVPEVQLAAVAGLPVAGGIEVDDNFSTIDPFISAIGDCAAFASRRYQSSLRLESVSNATDQAKSVASRLTGNIKPFDSVPWFWSDQGQNKLQIAGYITGCDDVAVRGDPDQNSFSVFCYKDGMLLGVESVNRSGDHMAARRLLASGILVEPDQARDLSFDLKLVSQPTQLVM